MRRRRYKLNSDLGFLLATVGFVRRPVKGCPERWIYSLSSPVRGYKEVKIAVIRVDVEAPNHKGEREVEVVSACRLTCIPSFATYDHDKCWELIIRMLHNIEENTDGN